MTTTWVLERDVFSESCFVNMVSHLQNSKIPYHIVRIIPFIHEIEGKVPEISNPVVIYGSIGSQKVAKDHGWTPGVWTSDGMNELMLLNRLGDMYLNKDALLWTVTDLVEYVSDSYEFFVKPNTDTKEFAGMVTTGEEFREFYKRMFAIGYLDGNDFEVVTSLPKKVREEYRCVIVDKKLVDYCCYKQHGVVKAERFENEYVVDLATRAARRYSPVDVYVMDICRVGDEQDYRVIEYNTFNSAGLYACDVGKIIDSINEFINK